MRGARGDDAFCLGEIESEMTMQGRCLCGAVAFEVSGKLPKLYQCHCSLCRKQSGSNSTASLIIKADNFRWSIGQDHISSHVKESGFRSDFCSRCGSPVPNLLRGTKYYWVPTGLLDGDLPLQVGAHLCVASKASWDTIPANAVTFAHLPADLVAFVAQLYE
jgi:hypothetical protein